MPQPNPSQINRPRDPLSMLGVPIVAAMLTIAVTSVVAVTIATNNLQCWRLERPHTRIVASARLCRQTQPLQIAGFDLYSPIAPLQWLNTFNAISEYSITRMRQRDAARVRAAYWAWLVAWAIGIGISITCFLGGIVVFRMTYKEPRLHIFGTRFYAERDEVLASGLVVGYKPSLRDRIKKFVDDARESNE